MSNIKCAVSELEYLNCSRNIIAELSQSLYGHLNPCRNISVPTRASQLRRKLLATSILARKSKNDLSVSVMSRTSKIHQEHLGSMDILSSGIS
jgi:hypothetical protein